MWLQLPDGSAFNLNAARSVKVGSAPGENDNFALVAEMPDGEEVALLEFHLPQAAQKTLETVVQALKDETRFLKLK